MEIVNGERLVLGTCYYPEHWDESLWRDDLKRMLENGIEVIRIAEFAWSKIERYEGVFNYDFFDRFLDVAADMGMKVIFCTPTATPPAWLTEKYPEVLNAKHGRCSVPPWRKKTLQLQLSEISGTDQNYCGKICISLCKTSGNHRMAD